MNCFFVTALRKEDTRTFGYFTTMGLALEAVFRNEGDMEECYYDHLIIEEIELNKIHPRVVNKCWFKWNHESKSWQTTDSPPEFYNVTNFALG